MQITRRQLRRIIREEAARARSSSLREAMVSAPGYTGLGLPDDAWDPTPDPAIAQAVTQAFTASTVRELESFVEYPTERELQSWTRNVEAEAAWLAAQVDKLVEQAYRRLFG